VAVNKSVSTIWAFLERVLVSKAFFYLILIFFAAQALYIALELSFKVAPDETFHIGYVDAYAQQFSPIIQEQTGYFQLGDITRNPSFLYHYVVSFPYRIGLELFGAQAALVVVRFVNILMAISALWGVRKVAFELYGAKSYLSSNLAILSVSSLPMFLLLSSSVNYDNSIIAISVWSIFFLIKFWQKGDLKALFAMLALVFAGSVIKYAFIPIMIAVLGLALLAIVFKHRKHVIKQLKKPEPVVIALFIVAFSMGMLNLERHGNNILAYGALRPNCNTVQTHEQCLNRSVYKRTFILESARAARTQPLVLEDKNIYVSTWLGLMRQRSFGVLGHKSYRRIEVYDQASVVLLALLAVTFIKQYQFKNRTKQHIILAVSLTYTVALFYTNYSAYRKWGDIDMAVQGRYIFPVLLPLAAITFYSLFASLKSNFSKTIVIAFILVVVAMGGLLNLVYGSSNSWWKDDYKVPERVQAVELDTSR